MNKRIISFILNGEPCEAICEDNMSLLDFIRDTLGLSLIHISEPTRLALLSRMPSSA